MTPEQFAGYMERIEALASDLPVVDALDLTDDDRALIESLPDDIAEEMRSMLAAVTPQSVDVRTELALKGVAALIRAVPLLARAVAIGDEMAEAT